MGNMPIPQALAAIKATAYRLEREGTLGLGPDGTVDDAIRFARHALTQAYREAHTRREIARYRIARNARRMIEGNAPTAAVWAEAHNINGEAGFPLTEDEVKQEVVAEAAAVVRARKWEARQNGR
jgi:hypothetical protein